MAEEVARSGAAFNLVVTVGDISVEPGAVNVIPGLAQLSLDVRASTDAARARAVEAIREGLRQIGDRRGLATDFETVHEKAAVACAPRFRSAIGTAISNLTGRRPVELVSGAGHDGLAMAHLTDIGMIFVRCRGGISHSPLEYVAVTDLNDAVEALIGTIVEIAHAEAG
jgi:acetylornithine deacetylase/succinyl-diaminopimelate desuccinylase-like protein